MKITPTALRKARERRRKWAANRKVEKAAAHDKARKVILGGLQAHAAAGANLYSGTANPTKVAKRRRKNKVAKQSRKVNR